MKVYLSFTLLFIYFFSYSQNDTIITKDNTILNGEIKEMDKGVLTFETNYSDSDFKIEWLQIKSIKSSRSFRMQLSSGDRLFGTIAIDTLTKEVLVVDKDLGPVAITAEEIVYIKHVESGSILDAINLSLDFGYSFTKSNELHQLNSSMNGDYYSKVWGIKANYNTVQSGQKNVSPTKRTTAGVGLKLFFKNDYFGSVDADYYSNNEQLMDLQSNYNIGYGKYFIHTNKIYFNTSLGIGYTFENFADTLEDRRSVEGKFNLEYNMFDIGDLNLYTNMSVLPSFTEKGRYRLNLNIQIKYDLPRDFYIKTGIDYKYDNEPVEGVLPEDYVFTIGFGWEL